MTIIAKLRPHTHVFFICLMHATKLNLSHCSISIPPENVRKSEVFGYFQRVQNWNIDLKWFKENLPKTKFYIILIRQL